MTGANERSRAGEFARVAAALLVSGLAIWMLARQIDGQAFLAALRSLNALQIALIIACFTAGLFVRGLVCWIILGKEFSFSEAFWAMNVGYLLNSILPLRLGEVGRAVLLVRHGRGRRNYPEVFAAIVTERMMDLMVGSLFFLATLPLMVGESNLKRVVIITAIGLLLLSVVIFLSARRREKLLEWLENRFGSNKLVRNQILPVLDKLLTGFQIFLKPKLFLSAFVLLALSWAMSMVEFGILQHAILATAQVVVPSHHARQRFERTSRQRRRDWARRLGRWRIRTRGVGKATRSRWPVVHAVQAIPICHGRIYVMGENGSLASARPGRRQPGLET